MAARGGWPVRVTNKKIRGDVVYIIPGNPRPNKSNGLSDDPYKGFPILPMGKVWSLDSLCYFCACLYLMYQLDWGKKNEKPRKNGGNLDPGIHPWSCPPRPETKMHPKKLVPWPFNNSTQPKDQKVQRLGRWLGETKTIIGNFMGRETGRRESNPVVVLVEYEKHL